MDVDTGHALRADGAVRRARAPEGDALRRLVGQGRTGVAGGGARGRVSESATGGVDRRRFEDSPRSRIDGYHFSGVSRAPSPINNVPRELSIVWFHLLDSGFVSRQVRTNRQFQASRVSFRNLCVPLEEQFAVVSPGFAEFLSGCPLLLQKSRMSPLPVPGISAEIVPDGLDGVDVVLRRGNRCHGVERVIRRMERVRGQYIIRIWICIHNSLPRPHP